MQFDARAASLLKPGEHIIVDDAPGLRLVATANRRSWIYRYKSPVDGRMRQIKLGERPAMSLAAAMAKWEILRAQRDAGQDLAADKRQQRRAAKAAPVAREYNVQALCDDYLAGHVRVHRKPKGVAEVTRMFKDPLQPIAHLAPAAVTRAVAFDFLEKLSVRPVAAANMRAELGAAWEYALDAGRLPEDVPNWWRQVMRGRLRSKGKVREGKHVGTVKRVLSEAELAQLLPWLANFTELVRDVLEVYLWTCARGAEIVAIQAAELAEEADGWWWTCPKAKTKNARHDKATDQRVPLEGRAKEVLLRRLQLHGKEGKGYLFPARGAAGHALQNGIQSAVHYRQPYSTTRKDDVRERLPVTHWSPHDLRRTGRTLLAAMGCPAEVAEAILGHMQPGVQGIYDLHRYDRERREWLQKLSARLERIATRRGT
ncbi:MAG: integrase family protein [Burkholderiaceae bacterium]|nr:MAG: integrase family protein [Burkholderiaceae bacterium]